MTGTTTFVARSPEDLLAVTPVVLGFHPQESVVMLGFGGSPGGFHARCDLPPEEGREDLAAALAGAAARNHVSQAAVLIYSADAEDALRQAAALDSALSEVGVRLLDLIRVDRDRWYALEDPDDQGTTYDVRCHPLLADRVLAGDAIAASRADLQARLSPGADEHDRQQVAAAAQRHLGHLTGPARRAAEKWAAGHLLAQLDGGRALPSAEAGRVLALLSQESVRDAVLGTLSRGRARAYVELLGDLVRRAPERLVPAPAALLAMAAWLSGNGALAWCGIDRARQVDPRHSLAAVVEDLLLTATSPRIWPDRPLAELWSTVEPSDGTMAGSIPDDAASRAEGAPFPLDG